MRVVYRDNRAGVFHLLEDKGFTLYKDKSYILKPDKEEYKWEMTMEDLKILIDLNKRRLTFLPNSR